jgi:predicted dehydrogenase
LQAGRLGTVFGARTVFTRPASSAGWKQHRRSGGGVLLDLASHHVDLLRFLFGQEVQRVQAWSESRNAEVDLASLTLELSGGVCAQSLFAAGVRAEDCLEVYGSKANAYLDRLNQRLARVEPRELQTPVRQTIQRIQSVFSTPYLVDSFVAPDREPSYRAALSHFFECIRLGRTPCPDLLDGYRSLAVVAAAEESARQARPIEVREIEGVLAEAKR